MGISLSLFLLFCLLGVNSLVYFQLHLSSPEETSILLERDYVPSAGAVELINSSRSSLMTVKLCMLRRLSYGILVLEST